MTRGRVGHLNDLLWDVFTPLVYANTSATVGVIDQAALHAIDELHVIYPEIHGLGSLMKHLSTGFATPPVVVATIPPHDPGVNFGIYSIEIGQDEIDQDWIYGPRDGRPPAYFRGFDPGMQETRHLKHMNTFFFRFCSTGAYDSYRTPEGAPRVGAHRTTTASSSAIPDPTIRDCVERTWLRARILPRP